LKSLILTPESGSMIKSHVAEHAKKNTIEPEKSIK